MMLIDFKNIQFPSFKYLKYLYNKDKSFKKILLFDIGVLGNGYFRCFEEDKFQIQFSTSIKNATKLLTLENITEKTYDNFVNDVIEYCNSFFDMKLECISSWPFAEEYINNN